MTCPEIARGKKKWHGDVPFTFDPLSEFPDVNGKHQDGLYNVWRSYDYDTIKNFREELATWITEYTPGRRRLKKAWAIARPMNGECMPGWIKEKALEYAW